ncbi:MAG: preprotein translocase subunit SecE [Thermodesulfobacteriota bacterium]
MSNRKNDQKKTGEAEGRFPEPKTEPDKKKEAPAGAKKAAPKKAAEKGPGLSAKVRQFFREVRVELRKVTWPSRKETMASTSVILVVVFLVALYLGAVDIILSRALKLLFQ